MEGKLPRTDSRFQINKIDEPAAEKSRVKILDDPQIQNYDNFSYVGEDHTISEEDITENRRVSFHETLPKVEHYKNSIDLERLGKRPSLTDLHEVGDKAFLQRARPSYDVLPIVATEDVRGISKGAKFGWIKGVMVRCSLNIWGVMLFLRLSWIVGQAGIAYASLIVLLSITVTMITAMSMSAICTNGEIKGGGAYFMISRSLGPEYGGAIGIIFCLANAIAVSMNVVGLAETVVDLIKRSSEGMYGISPINWVRIVGVVCVIFLLLVALAGMEWESKAQIVFLLILLVSFVNYFIGSLMNPSIVKKARGFAGYKGYLFRENFVPDFRGESFFSVFAIYFPSATGILAGANISGDLKDAQKAIPKGTFTAIIVTAISYWAMIWSIGTCGIRATTGLAQDVVLSQQRGIPFYQKGSPLRACNETLSHSSCKYGLLNDYHFVELASGLGPIISAGIFSATLSSAMACLVGASKVFQALCRDKLYPGLHMFAYGTKKNDDPVKAYFLTFIIAILFVIIGDLNLIAPIISNFFLMAYALINYSCFHASRSKSIGFRPGFKYYNYWISLIGSLLCLAAMFLIKWWAALVTLIAVLFLYLYISITKPNVNWGSSTQAKIYKDALDSVMQLNQTEEHVKNYRPQILVLCGDPRTRPSLLDFVNLFTKNISLLICGNIFIKSLNEDYPDIDKPSVYKALENRNIRALYNTSVTTNFRLGARSLMEISGLGRLRPNIVIIGFKRKWEECSIEDIENYVNVIHDAFNMRFGVGILKVKEGLDFSAMLFESKKETLPIIPEPKIEDDVQFSITSSDKLRRKTLAAPIIQDTDDYFTNENYVPDVSKTIFAPTAAIRFGESAHPLHQHTVHGLIPSRNGDITLYPTRQVASQIEHGTAQQTKDNVNTAPYRQRFASMHELPTSPLVKNNRKDGGYINFISSLPKPIQKMFAYPPLSFFSQKFGRSSLDQTESYLISDDTSIPNGKTVKANAVSSVGTENVNFDAITGTEDELFMPSAVIVPSPSKVDAPKFLDLNMGQLNKRFSRESVAGKFINQLGAARENFERLSKGQSQLNLVRESSVPNIAGLKATRSFIINNALTAESVNPLQSKDDNLTSKLSNAKNLGKGSVASNDKISSFYIADQVSSHSTSPDKLSLHTNMEKSVPQPLSIQKNILARKAIVKYNNTPTPSTPYHLSYMEPPIEIDTNVERHQKSKSTRQHDSKKKKSKDNSKSKKRRGKKGDKLQAKRLVPEFAKIFDESSSEELDDSPDFEEYYHMRRQMEAESEGNIVNKDNIKVNTLNVATIKKPYKATQQLALNKDTGVSKALPINKRQSFPANLSSYKGGVADIKESPPKPEKSGLKPLHKTISSSSQNVSKIGKPISKKLSFLYDRKALQKNGDIVSTDKIANLPTTANTADKIAEMNKKKQEQEARRFKALIGRFRHKYTRGSIDVWWLFDDGGLTILLPFIMSQRKLWQNCEMRVFAITQDKQNLDLVHQNFATMLTKFRIEFSHLIVLPDIHKTPYPTSTSKFEALVEKFRVVDENAPNYKPGMITDNDYEANDRKSQRHIRLNEMLLQHSSNANIIFITLPIPRKGSCPSALYMAWLEIMCKDLNPPIFLLRGNQQSVLTFYS